MIEEVIKIISDVGGAVTGFGRVEAASQGLAGKLQGIGGSLTGLGGKVAVFTAPLAIGLGVATNKAVNFDTAMSGASRALDLSEKEAKAFGDQAKQIAPALGMAPTKFAELATEAGRLGVAKNEIMGFSKEVAEIAAITDLTAGETEKLAKSFAALQTITGANTQQLGIYGAAVNKLDDAIGGTTPDIIEFTRQTAASGKLLKIGIKDLAAYGATMQSLGIQNGVAYRSFNALMTKLAAPQTLSKQARGALTELGLSAQQMAHIMTTDANAGIKLFLDRINAVSKVDVSRALGAVKQIIGADYGDEILTLAASSGKLSQALAAVGDNMDKANLAKKSDELAKKLGNVKGQQAIVSAQMERLAITVGSAVLPSVTDLLGMLTPLIEKFAQFAEQNPKLLKIALAIAAIGVSVAPVLIVIGSLISAVGSIMTLATAAAPVIAGIGAIFAGVTAPVWLTVAAFVAVGAIIGVIVAKWKDWVTVFEDGSIRIKAFGREFGIGFFADIREAFDAAKSKVAEWTRSAIALVTPAFNFIKEAATVTAMLIAMPYIQLATIILKGVNAAIAVAKPPLTAFFAWVGNGWNAFSSNWMQGVAVLTNFTSTQWQRMTNYLSSNWVAFTNWLGRAIAPVMSIGRSIADAIYRDLSALWGWVQSFVSNFFNAGVALAVNFANGIKAKFNQVIADFNAQLAQLRGMLPGSEPKIRSPLSGLADAGAATMSNFASGFSNPAAMSAMGGALSQARGQLAAPTAGNGGGGGVIVNDNRIINFGNSANSGTAEIIELLRKSDRELLDLIDKAQARWRRAT